jgi:hypothetical protein
MRKSKWMLYALLLGGLHGHATAQVSAVPPVPLLVREEFYENENGPESWRDISITSFLWASESLANSLLSGEKAEGLDPKASERLAWHQDLIAQAALIGSRGDKSAATCAPDPKLQADGRGDLGRSGSIDGYAFGPGFVLVRARLRAVYAGFGLEPGLPPRAISRELWALEITATVASRSDVPVGNFLYVLAGPGRLQLGQSVLCAESATTGSSIVGQEVYALLLPEVRVAGVAQLHGWTPVMLPSTPSDNSKLRDNGLAEDIEKLDLSVAAVHS